MIIKPEIVAIGASRGGLAALKQLVAGLPEDFASTILITMHIGNNQSILPQILSAHGPLPARHALDGDPLTPGVILVAPPDHHLLVRSGRVALSHGPKENFSRPAIDPLFRTAAAAYRASVIGVILTGDLDDGTVGLQAIKAHGGIAIVQDPQEAEAPSMPLSALRHVDVDHCLTLDGTVEKLVQLSGEPVRPQQDHVVPGWLDIENDFVTTKDRSMNVLEKIASPSPFTCPECHGSLWGVQNATPQRFRCHTGHAFTARSLASVQDQAAEEAIWAAVRALHEKEALLTQFEKKARAENRPDAAAEHAAVAHQARRHAAALRQMVCRDDAEQTQN